MCVAAPDECLFVKIKTGGLLLKSDIRMLFKKEFSSPCYLRGSCTPEQRGDAVQGARALRSGGREATPTGGHRGELRKTAALFTTSYFGRGRENKTKLQTEAEMRRAALGRSEGSVLGHEPLCLPQPCPALRRAGAVPGGDVPASGRSCGPARGEAAAVPIRVPSPPAGAPRSIAPSPRCPGPAAGAGRGGSPRPPPAGTLPPPPRPPSPPRPRAPPEPPGEAEEKERLPRAPRRAPVRRCRGRSGRRKRRRRKGGRWRSRGAAGAGPAAAPPGSAGTAGLPGPREGGSARCPPRPPPRGPAEQRGAARSGSPAAPVYGAALSGGAAGGRRGQHEVPALQPLPPAAALGAHRHHRAGHRQQPGAAARAVPPRRGRGR